MTKSPYNLPMRYLTSILLIMALVGCWGAGDRQTNVSFESQVERCFEGGQNVECATLGFDDDNRGEGESNDSEPSLTCEDTTTGPVVCGIEISITTAVANGDNPSLSDLLTKGENEVCKVENEFKSLESDYCELPNS